MTNPHSTTTLRLITMRHSYLKLPKSKRIGTPNPNPDSPTFFNLHTTKPAGRDLFFKTFMSSCKLPSNAAQWPIMHKKLGNKDLAIFTQCAGI